MEDLRKRNFVIYEIWWYWQRNFVDRGLPQTAYSGGRGVGRDL